MEDIINYLNKKLMTTYAQDGWRAEATQFCDSLTKNYLMESIMYWIKSENICKTVVTPSGAEGGTYDLKRIL